MAKNKFKCVGPYWHQEPKLSIFPNCTSYIQKLMGARKDCVVCVLFKIVVHISTALINFWNMIDNSTGF